MLTMLCVGSLLNTSLTMAGRHHQPTWNVSYFDHGLCLPVIGCIEADPARQRDRLVTHSDGHVAPADSNVVRHPRYGDVGQNVGGRHVRQVDGVHKATAAWEVNCIFIVNRSEISLNEIRTIIIVFENLKAMTHQPTQLLSWVELGPVGVRVIGLQLDFSLHSSLVPDN